MKTKAQFYRNLLAAFLAQGISLLMSLFMSFIVPKFLGIAEYSYWQLFIFYVGYVGFFHYGYNDGIYLKFGGKNYEELPIDELGTQFKIFAMVEIFTALMIVTGVNFFINDSDRRFVFIWTGIYLVVNNLTLFFGYIFQAVNETKIFSNSVILDRICVLLFIVLLLINKERQFYPFVITYTISKGIAFVYCIWKGRKIFFSKLSNIISSLHDMCLSISVGMKLTIANIMSLLILGIGRVVIDNIWGIKTFGKVSLALSLTDFFLVFLQQISMVLFPALRRIDEVRQRELYNTMRNFLGLFLPVIFVLYLPVKVIIELWLPQYHESVRYLAILLPLCTFDGKMQMLCNTYLKVLRKEKVLMQFNIFSFFVSLIMTCFCGHILNSMVLVVLAMVISIAIRSILAEEYLAKQMDIRIESQLIEEILLVFIFMVSTWFCEIKISFIIVCASYGGYLWINRKKVSVKKLKKILENKNEF